MSPDMIGDRLLLAVGDRRWMGLLPLQVAGQDLALNPFELDVRLDNLPVPAVFLRLGKVPVVKVGVERAGRQQFVEGLWGKSQLNQQVAPLSAERGRLGLPSARRGKAAARQ